ncbi:hypothetical protein [Rhodococcus sp. 27YEA15]|uniref:hypothetical protein n=1 Tax=Rhodococcus sp. 27YEA15 TaxID=3156259 RepID=UPI003C7EBAD6
MSPTYEDIGARIRSLNHEQRELVFELVATLAFVSGSTVVNVFTPINVDSILNGVAAELDEMAVPKVTNAEMLRAEMDILNAQMYRARIYRIRGGERSLLAVEARSLADRRLRVAQEELIRLREASK